MSYLTKIVVFCSSADREPADRIEAALTAACNEDGGLRGGFIRVDETFVGTVNYLDETALKDLLGDASQSTDGWNWYAPLTVILRGQDADNLPTILTLDDTGKWDRAI